MRLGPLLGEHPRALGVDLVHGVGTDGTVAPSTRPDVRGRDAR
ncbi:hypothetical protein RVR_1316 [Actinacidiphila reveromycinica]|uniref:Uncharacterized protein n=1 Tax=Actinacidiphila reveromycinica TaxID=659352 RepID=A0A7U3VM32_9ACTN|nr:hypothetical protein RVR_1316 [Streptomyces sp. SN-593]